MNLTKTKIEEFVNNLNNKYKKSFKVMYDGTMEKKYVLYDNSNKIFEGTGSEIVLFLNGVIYAYDNKILGKQKESSREKIIVGKTIQKYLDIHESFTITIKVHMKDRLRHQSINKYKIFDFNLDGDIFTARSKSYGVKSNGYLDGSMGEIQVYFSVKIPKKILNNDNIAEFIEFIAFQVDNELFKKYINNSRYVPAERTYEDCYLREHLIVFDEERNKEYYKNEYMKQKYQKSYISTPSVYITSRDIEFN